MSRLRIQLEGCLPWNPNLVLEALDQLFPKIEFLSFEEAREFVRSLKLKDSNEWIEYIQLGRKPNNIPSTPYKVYKDKWKGHRDFLGNTSLSFEDAKEFVKNLNIKNYREWRKYVESGKRPYDIPSCPQSNYKEKWKGWGDFLGTKSYRWKKNTSFVTFEECQKFIRKIGIKSFRAWVSWCKNGLKPMNIPFNPAIVYKGEWLGWKDFLGTVK